MCFLYTDRYRSRLSQGSEDDPPPMPKPFRINQQPGFISKTSAYAMLVDDPDKRQPRNATKNTTSCSSSLLKERHPATRIGEVRTSTYKRNSLLNPYHTVIGEVRTSTYKRNSLLNPYHTVPGSSLPRPASSLEYRPSSRATWDLSRSKLESTTSQILVGNAGNLTFFTPLIEDTSAGSGLPVQSEVTRLDTDANKDMGATSYATPPSTDDHDGTANVATTDERATTAGLDGNENTGYRNHVHLSEGSTEPPQTPQAMFPELQHWNVAATDEHSTTAIPYEDKNTDENDHARVSEEYIEPLPTQRPVSPEFETCIHSLPSTSSQPITTSLPSPSAGKKTDNNGHHVDHAEKSMKPPPTMRPMYPELEHWIQTLPSTTPQPMTTLSSSPPNTYKDVLEDLDVMASVLPVFASDEWGNMAMINDIPVGSKTRRIAEREVEKSRAQMGEATAARQQMGLRRGRRSLRRWFRRALGKIKMRKHGRPEIRW
jgi:hypothetical protein